MERIGALIPLVVGLVVVIKNRKFGEASVRSTRRTFGREPGRYTYTAGRVIAGLVGVGMVVGGAIRLLV